MEKWEPIKGYEKYYFISNEGRVYSIRSKRLIKPYRNSTGYLQIGLRRKKYLVHRLVALQFIDNIDNLPEINHINGRQKDNRSLNLEWCTTEYNNKQKNRLERRRKDAYQKRYGYKDDVF